MADRFDEVRSDFTDLSAELDRIGTLADGAGRALSRALRGAIIDGKSLQSVLGDVARSFADIALKAALKPVGDLAGGLIEGLFTASNPALGGVKPFAKGGVLASPAYFPMRDGVGLAGEAGPEAIMPLRRGADGRLGVAAGGGAAPVSITMHVTASDAASFSRSEAEISAMLLRAVRRGTRAS